jgi:hypothetical protein
VWQSDYQNRWQRLFFIVGILALAGFPFSPAFLGRLGAFVALVENAQWVLLLLGALALTFALIPLWRIGMNLRGTELREPSRREYAGLQLLGLAFVLMTIAPTIVAQAIEQNDSADAAIDLVIRTTDFAGVAIGFLTLAAPILISFGVARVNWSYPSAIESVARWAGRLLDLDWLARGIARLGEGVSALARGLAALAEENPTVWILLVALWIAIFILTTR